VTTLRILALLLAVSIAAAAPAEPNAYTNRGDAIRGLTATDAAHRVDAIVWIASNGTAADEKLLRPRLADESAMVRELAERGLWILWSRSGDAAIDALMEKGAAQMESRQLTEAIATYTEVIRRKPGFAEGWNRRATAFFLSGEFRRSLADCDQVMKRNPRHYGTLAGYGQIYFRQQRYDKAIEAWRRALAVNPNLENLEDAIEAAERLRTQARKDSV
jgi:tetratricopeptide (TPR) repeat protein